MDTVFYSPNVAFTPNNSFYYLVSKKQVTVSEFDNLLARIGDLISQLDTNYSDDRGTIPTLMSFHAAGSRQFVAAVEKWQLVCPG